MTVYIGTDGMDISLFTTFRGRINRKKYWVGTLILAVIEIATFFFAGVLLGVVMMMAGYRIDDPQIMETPVGIVSFVLMIVFLFPTWALYAKRLHDRNKSVRWALLLLVPIVGWLWLFVEVGFLRGTRGSNRFGKDPLVIS
jgi:uncharacterized membrane protein YhaH (DUF805 family)